VDHGFVDNPTVPQMLRHDPLEERRRHISLPYPFRIHDHDRPAGAHAEAGRFAAFHACGSEEETFTLQQRR